MAGADVERLASGNNPGSSNCFSADWAVRGPTALYHPLGWEQSQFVKAPVAQP